MFLQSLMPMMLSGGKAAISFATKNSNALLTTTALLGLTGTVVSVVKAVPKVTKEVEQMKSDLEIARDEETERRIKRAAIRKVAAILIVPALMILICGGSIIGNAYLNNKNMAALAAMYALSEQKIDDLEKAAKDIAGGKKAALIEEKASHMDIERRAPRNEEDVISTGRGNDLFWEPKTGHWLRANRDFILLAFKDMQAIVNDINADEDEMTLNRILENLKLPCETQLGNLFGWQPGDSVNVSLATTGKHFWDDGSDEYYSFIDYKVKYLGPEGKLT